MAKCIWWDSISNFVLPGSCLKNSLPFESSNVHQQEADQLERGSNNLKVAYSPQWQQIWRYFGLGISG